MRKLTKKKTLVALCGAAVLSCALCIGFSNKNEGTVSASAAENQPLYALAFNEYVIPNYTENTTVEDPFGNAVAVTDGKFTPVKEGEYILRSPGGKYTLQVFLSVPVSNYSFDFMLASEYATNEKITLPQASVSSAIVDEAKYAVYVEKEGVVEEKLALDEWVIQPDEAGDYRVIYTYVDYFGYISNRSFSFTVVDRPVIAFTPPTALSYGESVSAETVYAYCGSEKALAEVTVTSPDGTPVDLSAGSFVANQAGEYRWDIEAEIGGERVQAQYTASCDVYSEGVFSVVRMANQPIAGAEVPKDFYNEGEKGVLLQATATGGVYQYKNVVDLNSISTNENILSFAPYFEDGQGYVEDLTVKLTDVYDKYNSVSIQFKRSPFHNDYTYVTAEYAGRHYAFDNENWVLTGVNGPVKIGDRYFFGGIMPRNWSMVGKHQFGVKFDMYSFSMNYALREMILDLTSVGQGRYVLCDYDNPTWVGGEEYTWHGFTTGEAYLSIEFGTVVGDGAAIVVTEVMGQKLGSEVVNDVTPPSIIFEEDEKHLLSMPYGVVGKEYKLPTARAFDNVCGETQVVRKLYKNGAEVAFGEKFIPDSDGEYTVEYTSADIKGNVAQKSLSFTVYAEDEKPQIRISTESYAEPVTGTRFTVPTLEVEGASGAYTLKTKLEYNGKEVFADAADQIYVDEIGEIRLLVTLTDWLGQTAEESFTIPVETEEIDFTIPYRHGIAQKGRTLVFAQPIIYDFIKGDSAVETKITVNGTLLTDGKYTVADDDEKLTVCYVVSCGDKRTEKTYEIPVYANLANIFKTDAQYTVGGSNDDEVRFRFDEDGDIALVNAVSHNLLKISVAVTEFAVANEGNFYLDLQLQGAIYEEKIFVRVRKQDNANVTLQLNGVGAPYILDGSFTTGSPITFYYDCEKHIFKEEVSENRIFDIPFTVDGSVFNGFTGGAVKFSIAVRGMESGDRAEVRLVSISNESFAGIFNLKRDNGKPVMSLPFDSEVLTKTVGDSYTVTPVKAYDVIQGIFDAKVTVLAPDGSAILSEVLKEDYTLTFTEYGRYTLYYETEEPRFTVKGTREVYIDVVDVEKPVLTVKGEIPTAASVGDSWKVIGGAASDNVDASVAVKIVVYDPNYKNVYVREGDTYRFTVKGRYKIVYFATDAVGNTARTVYFVEVN